LENGVFVFFPAEQPRIYIEEGWYEKKQSHIRMLRKLYGILANYGWQTKTVFFSLRWWVFIGMVVGWAMDEGGISNGLEWIGGERSSDDRMDVWSVFSILVSILSTVGIKMKILIVSFRRGGPSSLFLCDVI